MSSIITLVVIMTINGKDFERHEIMPNIEQCWVMAAERMEMLSHAHIGEGTMISKIGVGCVKDAGDPA